MQGSSLRPQISLRTLLVVLMPLAALAALAVRWSEPRLVRTGNPYDVAIEGTGFFCVWDEFRERSRFARSGQLIVSANQQLGLRLAGEDFVLIPNISIPSDIGDARQNLRLTPDGRIVINSGGIGSQQGQLELYTFPAANYPQLERESFLATDELGTPSVWTAGSGPAGEIRQGHRELAGWHWDGESILTLLAGFALGALTTWLLRQKQAVKTATASPRPSSESPSVP